MICPRCQSVASLGARFCAQCGAALEAAPAEAAKGGEGRETIRSLGRKRAVDEPEQAIWQGRYSPKAMIGAWALLAVISLVALVGAAVGLRNGTYWGLLVLALVLGWVGAGLLAAYRLLRARYRLTSQRLFQERGILSRKIDRIELLQMRDVTIQQRLLERALDVGTICIVSDDRTDANLLLEGIDRVHEVAAAIEQARRAEQVRRAVFIQTGGGDAGGYHHG